MSVLQRIFLGFCALVAVASFVVGIPIGAYLERLDDTVTMRFEGQLFRIPSRVLSAPTILYPGLDWKRADLLGVFTRLGYQEATDPAGELDPGRYVASDGQIHVHLRAFDHPRRSEPNRDIVLELEGDEIETIKEMPSGREVAAVLLEPEHVGAYYGPHRSQRELVGLGDVPRHMIDAVLSVEDQRFETHVGVDPIRILGAVMANLRAGGIAQGGSTLTQQLVKNFFLTPERTYERKINEALMALIVELRYDKDAILEAYLNEIYLGQAGSVSIHGVAEASRLFFGKHIRDIGVAEAAVLAAIIHSPNLDSPYKNPESSLKRRDLVLSLMRTQGRIDDETYRLAVASPLRVAPITPEAHHVRYFLDALIEQLPEVYEAKDLTSAGLRIYSTLDPRLQRAAAKAVTEGLEELEKRFRRLRNDDPKRQLQACLVAVRPQTGEVVAMVGGRDYVASQYNRCTQGHRQTGSNFKPFVYAAGLEPREGKPVITVTTLLQDAPLAWRWGTQVWRPKNYDRRFRGPIEARRALQKSLNVPTARLAQMVGIERVYDMARRLGIESRMPKVPSLALGVADVAPIEMARAYATMANGGIRPELRMFEDLVADGGETVERREISFERAIDAGTAFLITSMLESVVDGGTGRKIRAAGMKGPVAGKTGTTNDSKDAWFSGYTPELVTVVWVGFDAPRSHGLTGGGGALPIWIKFMKEAVGMEIRGKFLPPPSVVAVECGGSRTEYFLAGTEPSYGCATGAGSYATVAEGEPRRATAGRARRRPTRREPARQGVRRIFDWLRRR